jgi:hypothetical protein
MIEYILYKVLLSIAVRNNYNGKTLRQAGSMYYALKPRFYAAEKEAKSRETITQNLNIYYGCAVAQLIGGTALIPSRL